MRSSSPSVMLQLLPQMRRDPWGLPVRFCEQVFLLTVAFPFHFVKVTCS